LQAATTHTTTNSNNTPLSHSTFHLDGRAEPNQLCSIRLVNVTGESELETIAGDGFRCPLSGLSHLVVGYDPK